jgi:hypothetical protein
VSRSEQMKPTVNALKESTQELRKYLNAFLDNVVMLILRDAQIQPFVNDQYVDLDMLLDDILELDDEVINFNIYSNLFSTILKDMQILQLKQNMIATKMMI